MSDPVFLYDFLQKRFFRDLLSFRKIADDVLSRDDADKTAAVVHHGDKILVHGAGEKFFHADGDADGEVLGFPENVPYLELLQILHGAGPLALSLVSDEPPEEIPLADGADVLSVPADDGDGGVAMVPHLFQSLPERVVVIEVRDAFFGKQEISDIHETAPFLEDGKPACIWLFGLYS